MPAQRPQDLVFDLFGECLLDREGPFWVGSLIELLGEFDLSPAAARTVLSRMAKKGWLRAEKEGRRSFYDLTPRGRTLLEGGAERIYHPPRDEPWDGSWHLIAYSIPEEQRQHRDRLRVRLSWLGCGSLGNGLWVSPHALREPVADIAEELGIEGYIEVFRAEHLGFSNVDTLVSQCWDLPAINRRYERFIQTFHPLFVDSREAADGDGFPPQQAFVRRLELIHDWREFPLVDPYLPRVLLPENWGGDCALWLFEKYHDLLAEPSNRYLDSILHAATAGAAV